MLVARARRCSCVGFGVLVAGAGGGKHVLRHNKRMQPTADT
jgi:hypothetical protein